MTGILAAVIGASAARGVVNIVNGNCIEVSGAPSSSISVRSDGTVVYTGSGSSSGYDWVTPKFAGVGNAYKVELTVNSGDSPTGSSTATELALSSNRTWTWTGAATASCTLELKDASGNVLDTATITVSNVVA